MTQIEIESYVPLIQQVEAAAGVGAQLSLHAGQPALLQNRLRLDAESQNLSTAPDVGGSFADLIRKIFRTNLVCIFSQNGNLQGIATEPPQLASTIRTRYVRNALQFAADLVRRAVSAGSTISVSIDPATHSLGDLVPTGMLLASPFRTSSAQGAILVYPRADGPFSAEEKSLLSTVAAVFTMVTDSAESCAAARSQLEADQTGHAWPDGPLNPLHWSEIFDAIGDFVVAHDASDKVLRVNRSLADFIGVQPQQIAGVEISALFAQGSQPPQVSCSFCRAAGDELVDRVHSVLDRAYLVSTIWVQAGAEVFHVFQDVTDRQEAERRYRELFDNIQEGVFFATPDGHFVEVNDALVHMLGYAARQELLEANIRTSICSSPEQYDEFTRLMKEQGSVRSHEQILRRADGTLIHVLVNAFAVRDAEQNLVQYRGVMQDISGLKTSQSELHRERDFSAKILDNTQSLIVVTDTGGVVRYANRRWYQLGYEEHQLLGRPLQEIIAPARHQAFFEALTSTLQGQQIDNLELQIVRGEGRVGHFAVNLSPMRDEQGQIGSIVVVMSDITDSATLQAKLMHAEKMAAVGQLVSGVAHEVNNPLTAILGFADLLMENPEIPEAARKDLRVILQEAQRTKQIVQNLLSFARQMPPQRKPAQLNVILRRTVQLRAYDLHSRGVEVIERLDNDLHPVIGDPHQLQQVFLNILNNAYDAVRDIGRPARIEIRTLNRDHMVEVHFRDNGKGIEFPERIFDPFFTTKEIGKGTGLGLSICYGIVREHGGEIHCHNNSDGEGATFVVRLPAASEPASVGAAAGGTQP